MQKLLPGVAIAVVLYLVVKYPSESADWVVSAANWLGDVFDSLLSFLKQLIE